MFSRKISTPVLRTLAASRPALQCLKPLSTMSVTSNSLQKKSHFLFTSSPRYFSSESNNADSSLSQILTEEILEETSRKDEEVDEDYEDVKKYITSVFQLSEKTGYGEVTLTRTYKNNETITIKFDCQDEADGNDEGDEQQDLDAMESGETHHHQVDEEDAEQLDGKFGIHFETTITKENGDRAVFSCIATHQQPTIVHVNYLSAAATMSSSGEAIEDATVYGGPRYDDLDPAVQGGFQQYLAERGVDEDLSFFIIQHSRYKEEAEYLHWLKSLNEFVN